MPKSPMAMRRCSGGNTLLKNIIVMGGMGPPPRPWRIRKVMSDDPLQDKAHRAELVTKRDRAST